MISLESDDPLPRPQPSLETSLSASSRPAFAQTLPSHSSDRAVAHGTGMAPHTRLPHGKASTATALAFTSSYSFIGLINICPFEIPVLTRHITAMGVSSGVTFLLLELQQAACESLPIPFVRTSNMVDTVAGLPLSSMRAAVMPTTLIMSCTTSALGGMIY